jgi:predicted site-specific integrase-resolvase
VNTPKTPVLINSLVLADMLNVHRNTITRWVASGRLPKPRQVSGTNVWAQRVADAIVAAKARFDADNLAVATSRLAHSKAV